MHSPKWCKINMKIVKQYFCAMKLLHEVTIATRDKNHNIKCTGSDHFSLSHFPETPLVGMIVRTLKILILYTAAQ